MAVRRSIRIYLTVTNGIRRQYALNRWRRRRGLGGARTNGKIGLCSIGQCGPS